MKFVKKLKMNKKRGAKCAFPVNASINEIAAHYTAEPNDPITIKDTDLVKIESWCTNQRIHCRYCSNSLL